MTMFLGIALVVLILVWPFRSATSRAKFWAKQAAQKAEIIGTVEHKRITGTRLLTLGVFGLFLPKKETLTIKAPKK